MSCSSFPKYFSLFLLSLLIIGIISVPRAQAWVGWDWFHFNFLRQEGIIQYVAKGLDIDLNTVTKDEFNNNSEYYLEEMKLIAQYIKDYVVPAIKDEQEHDIVDRYATLLLNYLNDPDGTNDQGLNNWDEFRDYRNNLMVGWDPGVYLPDNAAELWLTNPEQAEQLNKEAAAVSCEESATGLPKFNLWSFLHNPFWQTIGYLTSLIALLLKQVLGIIINLFLWFLTPSNFGGYVKFKPVQTLWTFTRNLTNIGLIVSLVFIAIATILRIKKYSWENTLWKIIVVALLVNFSLVICGILVDISNFFTTYFLTLKPITATGGSQIVSLKTIIMSTINKVTCAFAGSGGWQFALGGFIGLIMSAMFLGQFIGITGYTIIRVLTLWICLIFSPLAALAWAIPGLEKGWETWRNYFTQALISLPAISFSLWFVIQMINLLAEALPQTQTYEAVTAQGFVSTLAYAILILGLTQGVLIVAGALGLKQVQQGYQWGNKLLWGALGYIGGVAYKQTTRGAVSSQAWLNTAKKLEKSNWKPAHNLGIWLKEIHNKTVAPQLKQQESLMSGMSDDEIRRHIRLNKKYRHIVALGVNTLAERSSIKTKEDEEFVRIARISPNLNVPALKKANPALYAKYFSKPEDREKARDIIRAKLPDLKDKELEEAINTQLLLDQIKKSKAGKLEKGNWDDIFKTLEEKSPQIKKYFFSQLGDEVTSDSIAGIVKSLSDVNKKKIVRTIVEVVAAHNGQNLQQAKEYLLKVKGWEKNKLLSALLDTTISSSNSSPNT
ncbi:hypothetical protein J7K70_01855 [bacterium]|nr:hypothetical protein [bacterium]